ncbi:MAG: acyl--CoA ligase [Clostridia bacterium]|nr:acyl--CoA ligase [Clostridia bacterium]
MQELKLTGFPSIDKPWLKYYKEGAEERALNIPENKTVWDVIEEKLYEHINIPAIEYFGRVISRKEFIDLVYTWAKAFKAMGVEEDEIVAYYGPFFPDVGAMAFALNMIGACAYFLKLAISPKALAEETKNCRFAICFEDMWKNVANEFSKDRFKNVIIINAIDGMATPKKQIAFLLKKLKFKSKNQFNGEKYFSVREAKKLAKTYTGVVKAQFAPDRPAFITSSSGTTVNGVVKGCVATNESIVSQIFINVNSEAKCSPGDTCMTNFPPTASTSLDCLFIIPLFEGLTTIFDPRVSENDFYNQLTRKKPNLVIATGSMWEAFFNTISQKNHKNIDLSHSKSWIIGGEGTDIQKFRKWNNIVLKSNGDKLTCGYGSSELFSAICRWMSFIENDYSKPIMSVGIPYVGITVGIFDKNGNEKKYNQRGELWIKSKSAMKCYYNKPELTSQTKIDGWIHTGDLAEIDENGFVYIWGRVKDTVEDNVGNKLYLFDIAYKIKEKDFIDDAIVLQMKTNKETVSLVAHIVWDGNPSVEEQKKHFKELNALMEDYLPSTFEMAAYSVHNIMLPYSPTTLKKDKNRLSKQTDGYIQVIDGEIKNINFVMGDNDKYKMIIKD